MNKRQKTGEEGKSQMSEMSEISEISFNRYLSENISPENLVKVGPVDEIDEITKNFPDIEEFETETKYDGTLLVVSVNEDGLPFVYRFESPLMCDVLALLALREDRRTFAEMLQHVRHKFKFQNKPEDTSLSCEKKSIVIM
jgi:hypothetical protein